MNIYCISGLEADKRAFKYLSIKNHRLVHVDWVRPEKKETITTYCKKLSEQINTGEPFMLLGLSFGGIIVGEMAKFLRPKKVIHISSIIHKKDLPLLLRMIGFSAIHKIIPAVWMNPPMGIANWFFGVKKKANKQLLKEIFAATDLVFLKWAIAILLDKNEITVPTNLIRIHGSNDKLLPLRDNKGVTVIKDGGHFMVIEQADEVSEVLNALL